MNHRLGKRLTASQPVTLDVMGLGSLNGELKDISLSGAAIICRDVYLLECHIPVTLSMRVDKGEDSDLFSVFGFVARLNGPLIGIMFMQEMVDLLAQLRPDLSLSQGVQ